MHVVRNGRHPAAPLLKTAYYVPLCAVVEEHHVEAFLPFRRKVLYVPAAHLSHDACHLVALYFRKIVRDLGAYPGVHHALLAYHPCYLPGIHAADPGYALFLKEAVEIPFGPEIARGIADLPYDVALCEAVPLEILRDHSVITYKREGLHYYLPRVAGVRKGLQVPLHAGRKNKLAQAVLWRAYALSSEYLSVFKHQICVHLYLTVWLP